ncbi:hypothetical protein HTZ97_16315 [Desulfuromonas acetoxidans]|uniref:hypothetical protein n=1 Tax=Desulfuromonas acetoxidans TaxID=891 RepID=UPI000316E5D5|nr:hypothetical protein [Desulfuromonas acetoxidans]MBF0646890.1 hypothetical protein [Desulfuromonas acetoxidans]NVD26167.1 hypothetical protein [Desulfuromonas acetoxidans]NVE18021.1 hypothetical protein [Desulfuromonas acetoxidans]
MKPANATHKVSFYGVRCYWNETTEELWGVNWTCDQILHLLIVLHCSLCALLLKDNEASFPMKILEEYE